jgi:hypothetical protein
MRMLGCFRSDGARRHEFLALVNEQRPD